MCAKAVLIAPQKPYTPTLNPKPTSLSVSLRSRATHQDPADRGPLDECVRVKGFGGL